MVSKDKRYFTASRHTRTAIESAETDKKLDNSIEPSLFLESIEVPHRISLVLQLG
jgi:hypothetical protein